MKITLMVETLLLFCNNGNRIMTTFEAYIWKIKSRDMAGIWKGNLHLKILNNLLLHPSPQNLSQPTLPKSKKCHPEHPW